MKGPARALLLAVAGHIRRQGKAGHWQSPGLVGPFSLPLTEAAEWQPELPRVPCGGATVAVPTQVGPPRQHQEPLGPLDGPQRRSGQAAGS